jgi:nitrate reductase NapAB chaperone NapD
MGRYISKRTVFAAVVALALLSAIAIGVSRTRSRASKTEAEVRQSRIPATVLWAWERPTDLHFIDPHRVGVAFLARTIRLRGDEVIVKPRFQPLNLPEQTKIIAVVRVESDSETRPFLNSNQTRLLVEGIQAVANLPNVLAVQIDFDALRSEREFYRKSSRRGAPAFAAIVGSFHYCAGFMVRRRRLDKRSAD